MRKCNPHPTLIQPSFNPHSMFLDEVMMRKPVRPYICSHSEHKTLKIGSLKKRRARINNERGGETKHTLCGLSSLARTLIQPSFIPNLTLIQHFLRRQELHAAAGVRCGGDKPNHHGVRPISGHTMTHSDSQSEASIPVPARPPSGRARPHSNNDET